MWDVGSGGILLLASKEIAVVVIEKTEEDVRTSRLEWHHKTVPTTEMVDYLTISGDENDVSFSQVISL